MDNKTIIIRIAEIEDVNSISKIEEGCFPKTQRFGNSVIFALLYMSPKYLSYVALIGKEVIGYIIGEFDEDDTTIARIVTIAVKKGFQRNGIGERLLKTLEKRFKEEGVIQQIQLQVHTANNMALSFYKSNGFSVIKELRNYYSRRENAFLMVKRI